MNPTAAAPNSGIKLHATEKPGEPKRPRKEPRRWGWGAGGQIGADSPMVAWNRPRIRTTSDDRASRGRVGELGKLGRREGKGAETSHQPSWDAEEPMVEEVENPFIYEGEGVKIGSLCVDFRWHTTPFLVAQLLFSFFRVLFVSYGPHVFAN
jgi:hypothetical protein